MVCRFDPDLRYQQENKADRSGGEPLDEPVQVAIAAQGAAHSTEEALGLAILEATRAGRWDVVAQLARELEARRLGAAGVPRIGDRKSVV